MLSYVRRRAISSIIPLAVVLFGVFALSRATGDPARLYLTENSTEADRIQFDAQHGFNKPLLVQFGHYLAGLTHLDVGESLRTGLPASRTVLQAFPYTLKLAGLTMLLAVIAAILVGSFAAYRPNSLADRLASLMSVTAGSMPDFWLAIMLILIFSMRLGWVPTSGSVGASAWILPVVTLLIRPFGVLVQVVRGAMVSALSAPYIKLARSKGATEARVVFGHALRNAISPALTVAGDLTVGLVNGAVVVETIFGWPGIGNLMITSIQQRDFAVVQAAVMVTALTIFALNILIDVGYALLDPRIRQAVAR